MDLTIFPEKLSLSYVSRYVFGFGFAVAIPCIVLAFSLSWWTSSWDRVKRVWHGTTFESTNDPVILAKDKSPKFSEFLAQTRSTQAIDRLTEKLPATPQAIGKRVFPSLKGLHETTKVPAGLKKRWRSWRKPEVTDLPK